MIALSVALGSVGLAFVIAAWHVALQALARRDAIEALRHDVEQYQDHVDKALINQGKATHTRVDAVEKHLDAMMSVLVKRLEAAEVNAADLASVARDMRNARALAGGKRA